jgi:hypothetical protein
VATLEAAGVTDPPGQPVPADEVVGFFVLGGDANRDMKVNSDDFNILATNFGTSGGGFILGDFTYNGIVDSDDFNLLAANFGKNLNGTAAARTGLRRPTTGALFSTVRVTTRLVSRPIDLLRDDPTSLTINPV